MIIGTTTIRESAGVCGSLMLLSSNYRRKKEFLFRFVACFFEYAVVFSDKGFLLRFFNNLNVISSLLVAIL